MPRLASISPAQLARLVGTPAAPQLIDVRIDEDVAADPTMLPLAMRCAANDVRSLRTTLGERGAVVYCQKGLKLSSGAAALLRAAGVVADVLEGGHLAWRDAALPLLKLAELPRPDGSGHTRWVTRQRPKIDRVACPWLIRRFIDADAGFLFVPADQVLAVADRFSATPFDVAGAQLTHIGERCSFDSMLERFALHDPALQSVARIVRAADTDRCDAQPQASGLLAILLGFSRMYRNDNDQVDAAMPVFDALYRWARDASDETHDWPGP